MSKVFLIADLHLGHANVIGFAGKHRPWKNVYEHDEALKNNWLCSVTKRDVVYVLGDVAFSEKDLKDFGAWPGRKILVRGNHDRLSEKSYRRIFEKIYGIFPYKGFWITHCPIHPQELRGRINIHGHIHANILKPNIWGDDKNYVNVCVEACQGRPVPFTDIRAGLYRSVLE